MERRFERSITDEETSAHGRSNEAANHHMTAGSKHDAGNHDEAHQHSEKAHASFTAAHGKSAEAHGKSTATKN
jgi:hypothetical protein